MLLRKLGKNTDADDRLIVYPSKRNDIEIHKIYLEWIITSTPTDSNLTPTYIVSILGIHHALSIEPHRRGPLSLQPGCPIHRHQT